MTGAPPIRVSSDVLFWDRSVPKMGKVIGLEDGGFMVETADDVVFVREADCRSLGHKPQ